MRVRVYARCPGFHGARINAVSRRWASLPEQLFTHRDIPHGKASLPHFFQKTACYEMLSAGSHARPGCLQTLFPSSSESAAGFEPDLDAPPYAALWMQGGMDKVIRIDGSRL